MREPYYRSPDGRIVIYCGDCLEIIPELEAESIDAIVTDPPYGIGWRRGRNDARASKAHPGIANDMDTTTRDAVLGLLPDKPAIVFGSFYSPFPARLKQVLVWHKPADSGLVGAVTGWRRDAEPIFLVGKWPRRKQHRSSVLHVRAGQSGTTTKTGHPHTKPLPLMIWLLEACARNALILDPFLGSGTTLVACVQTGRRGIGIEISEEYCRIAKHRIERALMQHRLPLEEAAG